ncbi:hypothetical protein AAW14_25615 [Streptomyces hygroscopicus]|uniref:hypothetical protein n=1 Tax=Streptomyces hygroscopicus TaxID=1912 RepID=UPI00224055C9|nr:hypothetical protein [Streptomyces hygroscopicus]MCW7945282.1 hypothetical protein [Streptomyces hygroscopicus]
MTYRAYRRCPNCGDTMQDFRELESNAEKAAAQEVLGPQLEGRLFVPKEYHRCARPGCRRVQRKDRWSLGATLPEGM